MIIIEDQYFIDCSPSFTVKKQPVPLIPWSNKQLVASLYQPFIILLHKLGFQLAADARKLFARIPENWTHEHLLSIAMMLGPIPIHLKQRWLIPLMLCI